MDPQISDLQISAIPQRERALHIVLSLNKGLPYNKIDLMNAFLEVFITNSVVQHDIVSCQLFLLAGDEINVCLHKEMIFGGHFPITKERLQNTRRKLFGNFPPILKKMKKEYDTYLLFITDGNLDFKTIPTTSPHVNTFTALIAIGCQVTLHKYSAFDQMIYAQNYEDMVIKMPEIEKIFQKSCYVHSLHASLMTYFPDKLPMPQKENIIRLFRPTTPTKKSPKKAQPYFKVNKTNISHNVSTISLFLEPVDSNTKPSERYSHLEKLNKTNPPSNLLEYERYSCTLSKILGALSDYQKQLDDYDEVQIRDPDKISEAFESEENESETKLEYLTFAKNSKM